MNDNESRVLIETEQRSKSNQKRIDNHDIEIKEIREENRALYELSTSIKLIVQGMDSIKDDIKEVKNDITEVKDSQQKLTMKVVDIENAPDKKTADIVGKVKVAIITAIGTMIATGIFGSLIFFAGK